MKIHSSLSPRNVPAAVAAALLLLPGGLYAQSSATPNAITWGAATNDTFNIFGTAFLNSDVRNNGMPFAGATNGNQPGDSAAVVNGVSFTGWQSSDGVTVTYGSQPITAVWSGNASSSRNSNGWGYPSNHYGDFGFDNAGGSYNNKLLTGGGEGTPPGTITIGSLTAGTTYQIQLFAPTWNQTFSGESYDNQPIQIGDPDGGPSNGGTPSQNIIGAFVAGGATESFQINDIFPSAISVRQIVPNTYDSASGDWNNSAAWNPAAAPTTYTPVVVSNGKAITIDPAYSMTPAVASSLAVTDGSVEVKSGQSLSIRENSLSYNPFSVSSPGTFTLDSGATLNLQSVYSSVLTAAGVNLAAGSTLNVAQTFAVDQPINLTGVNLGAMTTLSLSSAMTLGNDTLTANLYVNNGGTLDLGGHTLTASVAVFNDGTTQNGAIANYGSSAGYQGWAGTVSAALQGTAGLSKSTGGTLVLSGNNSYAGGTLVQAGVLQYNALSAVTANVNVQSPAAVAFGGPFGAGNIQAALSQILPASTGAVAADNYGGANLNFNTAGLATASLGALASVNYTGTLTPYGNTYNLGGGGGTLIFNPATYASGDNLLLFANGNTGTVDFAGQGKTFGAITIAGGAVQNGTLTATSISLQGGTVSAVLAGPGAALTASGNGPSNSTATLIPSTANTFTGGVAVNQATLVEDFSNMGTPTDLVNNQNVLTLGGGVLQLNGKGGTDTSQTFASTTLTASSGFSSVALNQNGANSLTVNLGAVTRNVGSMLDISDGNGNPPGTGPSGIVATTTTGNDSSGILGPWATVAGATQYATVNGSHQIVPYTGASVSSASDLSDINSSATNFVYPGSSTINNNMGQATLTQLISAHTLLYTGVTSNNNGGSGDVITLNGNNITLDGLLCANSSGPLQIGPAGDSGNIYIGPSNELVMVLNRSWCNIGAPIADNPNTGQPGALTVLFNASGGETPILGDNTYSGPTTINGLGPNNNQVDFYTFGNGTGPVAVSNCRLQANQDINGNGPIPWTNNFTFNNVDLIGVNITGAIKLAGSISVNYNTGVNSDLSGPISGAGGITVASGNLELDSSASSYTGQTAVQGQGTLQLTTPLTNVGVPGPLGALTGANAVIQMYNGTAISFQPQQPSSGTANALSSNRPIDLADNGAGTVLLYFGNNDTFYTFNGPITATGTGPKTLAMYPGYNGAGDRLTVTFNAPISDSADGSPTSLNVTFYNSASQADAYVNLNAVNTFTGSITLSNLNLINQGYLVIGGFRYELPFDSNYYNVPGTGCLGSGSYAGAISLDTQTTLDYDSTATQVLSGPISGPGAVMQDASGHLVLSGANTYTGATTINAGTLQFGQEVSLYGGSQASWTAANISVASGATIAFNVGGTGEFSNGDVTALLTNLVAGGGLQGGAAIGFDTSNAGGGTFTIPDTIADSSNGPLGLTKLGSNTLVLSGLNTYSGNTTVTGGALVVTGTVGGGASQGSAHVLAGTLEVDGQLTATNLYVQGSGQLAGSGTIDLPMGGDGLLYTSTATSRFAGILGNIPAGLEIDSGTLILSGTSNYSGLTNVVGGELIEESATALPRQANLAIAAGATILFDPAYPSAGPMQGLEYAQANGRAQLSAVPEPGSLVLLLAGLTAGFGVWWRRRRAEPN